MNNTECINTLTMCKELMLFDPMTGETHDISNENRDNQDLYNALTYAIAALSPRELAMDCKTGNWVQTCGVCGFTVEGFRRPASYCANCGSTLKGDTA